MRLSILAHAGYTSAGAYYDIAGDNQLKRQMLTPSSLTLRFSTETRYCSGWHDLETGESHTCPDNAAIDRTYTHCPACQKRTGFNPAFYHATTVSEQQQKRNQEPHILYIAYFAPGVLKVGISHAARGTARLLEQGARAAIILDTYPSALIARQYEAKIARQTGIYEHLSTKQKRSYYGTGYDTQSAEDELLEAANRLAKQLSISFSKQTLHLFWPEYFFDEPPDLSLVQYMDKECMISGDIIGSIGTDIIATNDGRALCLNLKSFVGYPVDISEGITTIDLAPVQPSLF